MNMTMTNNYASLLKAAIANNPTFKAICDFNIQQFPANGYFLYNDQLFQGMAGLKTAGSLNAYMAFYAEMHQHKLIAAFDELFKDETLHGGTIEVVDWGCGQALASCVLVDYIREHHLNVNISRFNLIDVSSPTLERGKTHLEVMYQSSSIPNIEVIESNILLSPTCIQTSANSIKIHLFSNVLDMPTKREHIQQISNAIRESQLGMNYFICVSPNYSPRARQSNEIKNSYEKLKMFRDFFPEAKLLSEEIKPLKETIFRPKEKLRLVHFISRVQFIFKTNF